MPAPPDSGPDAAPRPAPGASGARARKNRDRAGVLVIVGALCLMPPLVGAFPNELRLAGVPLDAFYVFAVWAVLIAGTAWLARRLGDDTPSGAAPDRSDRR